MPSKSEKERRKALRRAAEQKEFNQEISNMPISKNDLKDLFKFLDRPNPPACSHTLKATTDFLKKRNLDTSRIIPWLNEYGGFCDCEVIFNVYDKWGEYVGCSLEEEFEVDDDISESVVETKSWWKFWK